MLRQGHCLACALDRLIGVAAKPQHLCEITAAANARIVSGVGEGKVMMAVGLDRSTAEKISDLHTANFM